MKIKRFLALFLTLCLVFSFAFAEENKGESILDGISPIDIIPDMIPNIGFTDDAMAVSFCVKMIHDDLEKYKVWQEAKHKQDF